MFRFLLGARDDNGAHGSPAAAPIVIAGRGAVRVGGRGRSRGRGLLGAGRRLGRGLVGWTEMPRGRARASRAVMNGRRVASALATARDAAAPGLARQAALVAFGGHATASRGSAVILGDTVFSLVAGKSKTRDSPLQDRGVVSYVEAQATAAA